MAATLLSTITALDLSTILFFLLGLYLHYILFTIIHRLYLHPLRHIPGPKLAALTYLTEFYHNVVHDGTYYKTISSWHKYYNSPIIRITPDEVHLSSPETYDAIYRIGSKYTKDPGFYLKFTGMGASIFTTVPNWLHKTRRAPLMGMFSKRSIDAVEHIIQKHTRTLIDRLLLNSTKNNGEGGEGEGESVGEIPMFRAIRCVSVDTVSEYCFGKPFNLTKDEEFGKEFFDMMRALHPGFWTFRHLPIWMVYVITHNAPMVGKMAAMLKMREGLMEQVVAIRSSFFDKGSNKLEREKEEEGIIKHRTIFHELLSTYIPQEDYRTLRLPTNTELVDEAVTFTIAASETTGMALELTLLGILSNPTILSALKSILNSTFPDGGNMPLKQLESLPYLTACIKEGLRLSHGIIGRLPRVVTEPNVQFHGYDLPIGTVVSQSNYLIHRNPSLFVDPDKFMPERWLDGNKTKDLDKYLVSFSKGPRACIGLNLAWAELYIIIAGIVRNVDLKVVVGGEGKGVERVEDVKLKDYFSAFQEDGVGLRVVVVEGGSQE